ncbi:MAG TPA: hypothetical protein VKS60_12280 [Stellaceae bacterium]|nr:hypothetical protein [Stellaceae bacterium]
MSDASQPNTAKDDWISRVLGVVFGWASSKPDTGSEEFYALLEVAERDFQQLETHANHRFIEDQTPGIEQGLQVARDTAKTGDFGAARKALDAARSASEKAAQDLNRFGIELAAFNKEASATEGGLTYLDGHPNKHVGAGDIGTATGLLAAARQDAQDCDLPAARQKLAEAEAARIKAKEAADNGVIAMIDDAKKQLDAVLTGADPAVAKAMAPEIGLIDAKLNTARSLVATDIQNADKALDEAIRDTMLAEGNRDQALVDITKLRADAQLTDGALKKFDAHPQRLHADAEVQIAVARVASAKSETEEGHITAARQLQTEADENVAKAKDFADKYAAFLVKYADEVRFCNGLIKNFSGWRNDVVTDAKNVLPNLQLARDKANTQRKYTEAESDLTNATQALRARKDEFKAASANQWDAKIVDLTNKLTTIVPTDRPKTLGKDGKEIASMHDTLDPTAINAEHQKKLDELKKDPIHGESLKKITEMKAAIQADADAGRWNDARYKIELMINMVTAAEKLAKRRATYNTDRALTVTAIDGLKIYRSLMGHMMSLNNLLLRADKLATSKDMRFEDACEELADIRNTCTLLVDIGKGADTYIKERAEADEALEELEKKAA